MKLSRDQSGASHIVIILLVVLIVGLGFAGWRVYDLQKQNNDLKKNTSQSEVKNTVSTTIPDDFVEYKNKELAFSFAYPKTWGDVNTTTFQGFKSINYDNSASTPSSPVYVLEFSKNADVHASLTPNDYSQGPKDGASPDYLLGFCRIDQGIVLSRGESASLPGAKDGYLMTGKEKCDDTKPGVPITSVDEQTILIPSDCYELGDCSRSESQIHLNSVLIRKTGITMYPGFKLVGPANENSNVFTQIAKTFNKL